MLTNSGSRFAGLNVMQLTLCTDILVMYKTVVCRLIRIASHRR